MKKGLTTKKKEKNLRQVLTMWKEELQALVDVSGNIISILSQPKVSETVKAKKMMDSLDQLDILVKNLKRYAEMKNLHSSAAAMAVRSYFLNARFRR